MLEQGKFKRCGKWTTKRWADCRGLNEEQEEKGHEMEWQNNTCLVRIWFDGQEPDQRQHTGPSTCVQMALETVWMIVHVIQQVHSLILDPICDVGWCWWVAASPSCLVDLVDHQIELSLWLLRAVCAPDEPSSKDTWFNCGRFLLQVQKEETRRCGCFISAGEYLLVATLTWDLQPSLALTSRKTWKQSGW